MVPFAATADESWTSGERASHWCNRIGRRRRCFSSGQWRRRRMESNFTWRPHHNYNSQSFESTTSVDDRQMFDSIETATMATHLSVMEMSCPADALEFFFLLVLFFLSSSSSWSWSSFYFSFRGRRRRSSDATTHRSREIKRRRRRRKNGFACDCTRTATNWRPKKEKEEKNSWAELSWVAMKRS